jgi:two-component system chemotaxis response regulator CheB
VIVQSPDDALVASMPASAIAATEPDAVLPAREIGSHLARLVAAPRAPDLKEAPVNPEPDPADLPAMSTRPDGPPSGFTCPECRGPLWEVQESDLVRYRCRVGHAYSEQVMVEAQGGAAEAALWTALEVLQERSELLTRIADRMRPTQARTQHRFREGARQAEERAAAIRRVLAMGDYVREEAG